MSATAQPGNGWRIVAQDELSRDKQSRHLPTELFQGWIEDGRNWWEHKVYGIYPDFTYRTRLTREELKHYDDTRELPARFR